MAENKKRKKQVIPAEHYDARIVELLHENGRRTLDSMANELGISISNVNRRMQDLLNNGALEIHATVRVDLDTSPIFAVSAMDVSRKAIPNVIKKISNELTISSIVRTIGRFDLISFAYFKSQKELAEYVEQVLQQADGIKSSKTYICMSIYKGNYRRINPYLLEPADRDLIALLMKDSSQTNQEIARKLNVSPSSISRRITQLVKSDTIRFTTPINDTVNPPFLVALFARVKHKELQAVATVLSKYPEVAFLASITGHYDLCATLWFKN